MRRILKMIVNIMFRSVRSHGAHEKGSGEMSMRQKGGVSASQIGKLSALVCLLWAGAATGACSNSPSASSGNAGSGGSTGLGGTGGMGGTSGPAPTQFAIEATVNSPAGDSTSYVAIVP